MSSQKPPGGGSSSGAPKGGARKGVGTSKGSPKGSSKGRRVARKILKWMLIVGLLGTLGLAIAIYVTYKMIDIPDPNENFQAQTSTVYYSDGQHVLGQFALQNRESIGLDEVPQHVQDAVVAAENRTFWTDSGIDPKGIVRAAWSNLNSDSTQGASTITQQYVKVLYLSQEQTYTRKIKEAFLAVKVENQMSKKQILEGYLNTIYYGRGAYGIQAAAQAYFDEDAKDLTVRQGAVLASVLNSPGNLDPAVSKNNRPALLGRYRYVLHGMADTGTLSPHKADKAAKKLPKFPHIKSVNAFGGQKGYLMTLVEDQLAEHGFTEQQINGGGLRIVTTFNWKDMRSAGQAVKEVRPDGKKQLHLALASVQPGTGALRAMIGGRNYLNSQYNWATQGGQPGSTFKAYALAAALKDGFTLYDTFDGSSPYYYPDGSTTENQGGESFGFISLLTATEESVNTAYIDMTMQMDNGPEKIIDAAYAAGIPRSSHLDPYPAVALGSSVVSPISMAEGYATFAANGQHADWYVLQKVSDANGVQYEHQPELDRAFATGVASNVTYALEQVVKSGTGTTALSLGRPAAGKTGTATSDKDVDGDGANDVSSSWFVGYTPQLATSVMMVRGDGNDALDTGYVDNFYGGGYPAETWTTFMTDALQGEPIADFPAPEDLPGTDPTPTYVPPSTTHTPQPTTTEPTTTEPTTTEPTTTQPTTTEPTTTEPTTTEPTTTQPTTTEPTTTQPTTLPTQPTKTPPTSPPGPGQPGDRSPPAREEPTPH